METHEFLTPDYYPHFHCKMGACRTACCEGWPITFSLQDYFNLLSLDCSPDLRRKLDISLHIAPRPTPEGYAQILPRYDGQCPMRLDDGRCALHAEKGEEVLSVVCRLYPRGVRSGGVYECSCANSCEAVLELLLTWEAPLAFHKHRLTVDVPPAQPRQHVFESAGREEEIRLWLIAQMQNRAYPLAKRMMRLGLALRAMDEALGRNDHARVQALLSGEEAIDVMPSPEAGHDQLCHGLEAASLMLEILDERSESIRAYGEEALDFFSEGEGLFQRYTQGKQAFEALVPQWETWFEHMLVNHMFFVQFPFQDRPVPLKDEYLALCAVYTLLRFLCIGCARGSNAQRMVDICAAAFRLVEHTEFDRYAAPILRQIGCDGWTHLHGLLCL